MSGVSGRILKGVATAIALRARDNGSGVHPGVGQIALCAHVNYTTARRALAHLSVNEWILLERRGDERRRHLRPEPDQVVHKRARQTRSLRARRDRAPRAC